MVGVVVDYVKREDNDIQSAYKVPTVNSDNASGLRLLEKPCMTPGRSQDHRTAITRGVA